MRCEVYRLTIWLVSTFRLVKESVGFQESLHLHAVVFAIEEMRHWALCEKAAKKCLDLLLGGRYYVLHTNSW